jgi:hypothetical protein
MRYDRHTDLAAPLLALLRPQSFARDIESVRRGNIADLIISAAE